MAIADAQLSLSAGWTLAAFALPVATVVAIVRYGLYDIDLIVHRGLLYGALTLALLLIYIAVVNAAAISVAPRTAGVVAATVARWHPSRSTPDSGSPPTVSCTANATTRTPRSPGSGACSRATWPPPRCSPWSPRRSAAR